MQSKERQDGGRDAWTVVIGSSIGLAVAFGPAFIASFGLYIKPISEEFGWSRTEVSSLYSIAAILGAVGTPFLGFLIDRKGARPVIIASSLGLPITLALLVTLPANYLVYLAWAVLVGLISIVASPTAYVSLLPQWFSKRLGLAVAIAMFGSGLGQFLLARSHGWLLEHLDWRSAWLGMTALVAVVGVLAALVSAKDRPSLLKSRKAGREQEIPGIDLGVALRSSLFWTSTVSFFLVMLITAAMLTHLPSLLTDRGWTIAAAAGAVAMIGLVSLIGRAISGALLDRLGFGVVGTLLFPFQALGCLLLLYGTSSLEVYTGAACIGLSYGVEADMLPWSLRRSFGLRCFGRLYGAGFGIVQLGSVLGPIVMGASFDLSGGYATGLWILTGASLVATLLVVVAARAARHALQF